MPNPLRALRRVLLPKDEGLESRNPLRAIPGYAGSDLGTQINEEPNRNPLRLVSENQVFNRSDPTPADDPRIMSVPNGRVQYNDRVVTGNNEPLAYGDFRDRQASEGYPQSNEPGGNPLRAALGNAPAPPVWNPIVTDPSGRPRISQTATGPATDIQRKEYDALQAWNPQDHEHKGNRLKSALSAIKGAIQNNPGVVADPIGLLTTVLVGGVRGAADPSTADQFKRKRLLREAGSNLGNSLAFDKEQAQVEQDKAAAEKARNPLRHAMIYRTRQDEKGNTIRQHIDPETNVATDDIGPDGKPIIEKLAPTKTTTERAPLMRERKNIDGTTSTLMSEDNGHSWKEVSDLTSAAPAEKPKQGEDLDKLNAEYQAIKTASDTARGYADHIDKNVLPPLYGRRGEVKAEIDQTDWSKATADNPQLVAKHNALSEEYKNLNSQISRLEKDRNDHYSEASTKAADSLKFKRDRSTPAPAPKGGNRKSGIPTTTTPTTHGFSMRAWLSHNPGKSEADAKAFHDNDPKYKNYPLLP